MILNMAFISLVILFYLVTSSSAGKHDEVTRDIVKEFDDFKVFVASKLEAMSQSHARDMQGLKDIIDTQKRRIQKLEAENALKNTAIQEDQKKTKDMSFQHRNVYENAGNSSSDKMSEQPKNNVHKSNIFSGKRGPRSLVGETSEGMKVAFFATVTNTLTHLGQDQDIIFDHAVTNIGNGYLPHHGTFVAPVTGTYVFSVALHYCGSATTWGHFVVHGSIVAKLDLVGHQASQMIVVNLRKGEDVSVQNTETDRAICGDRYSTFSGFLLYEDFSVNQIVG